MRGSSRTRGWQRRQFECSPGRRRQEELLGFNWPSQGSGIWEFQANVAHNNKCQGIFVWQNSAGNHIINDFIAFETAPSASPMVPTRTTTSMWISTW